MGPGPGRAAQVNLTATARSAGFSLVELAIVVAVAAIFMGVFLFRVPEYQEYAEKTAMELTAMNVRSSLRARAAELIMRDRTGEIASLLGENPVKWLETPPPNYLGELANPEPGALPAGNWYFDTARLELVYVPRGSWFSAPGKATRYRVAPASGGWQQGGVPVRRIEGVTLTRVS